MCQCVSENVAFPQAGFPVCVHIHAFACVSTPSQNSCVLSLCPRFYTVGTELAHYTHLLAVLIKLCKGDCCLPAVEVGAMT